jgi:hypothetical protein
VRRAWNGATETTAALQAFLFPAAGHTRQQFAMVDLYTFTLPFGAGTPPATPLRYCGAEVDVSFEGNTYTALRSRPTRGNCKVVVGVEVDTLDVTILPYLPDGTLDVIPGTVVTIPLAAQSGLFDGAAFTLRRLYLSAPPVWGTAIDPSLGAVTLFGGTARDIEVRRSVVLFTIASGLQQLNTPIPRNVYQPGCRNTLFDGICNLAKTGSFGGQNFQASATLVASTSTSLSFTLNAATSQPDHYFDLGYVEVASGPFVGLRRTIKQHIGTTVTFIQPWPFALPDGQALTLQAGCDKQLPTCDAKFGNRGNFNGEPFIPVPDSAV